MAFFDIFKNKTQEIHYETFQEKDAEIKLKKIWNFKIKGLRNPLISVRGILNEDNLYYFVNYDKAGFDESKLVRFDLINQKEEILFTESHCIRNVGAYENGHIYFTSFSGKLYCLDDNIGEIVWKTSFGDGNANSNIIVDDEYIYAYNSMMVCIKKEDGAIVWESNYLDHSGCKMCSDDTYIYHGNSDGSVYCMNKSDGKIVWKYGRRLYPRTCLMYNKDILLVALNDNDGDVMLLNPHNGNLITRYKTKDEIDRPPVIENNNIYIGIDSGKIFCLTLTGKNQLQYKLQEKFVFVADSAITSECYLTEQYVFFGTKNGYIYALDKESGKEVMCKKVTSATRWISQYKDHLLTLSDKGQVEFYEIKKI